VAPIDRVNEIMKFIVSLGLFEQSGNRIFCFKLLRRLDTSMTSSQKFRGLITEAKAHHDIVMMNHDGIMQDKNRIDIRKEERERPAQAQARKFTPPSVEEIQEYCKEKQYSIDAELFVAHYNSNGWKVGSQPMKSWKDAITTWRKWTGAFNRPGQAPESKPNPVAKYPPPPLCPGCGKRMREGAVGVAGCKPCMYVFKYNIQKAIWEEVK